MHGLAIAMAERGYQVTGSDASFSEPVASNLKKHGLLPSPGFHPDRVDGSLEALVIGSRTTADNPELKRALELGIPVKSFPELVLSQSQDKQRVVAIGSRGKTMITALIIHTLNFHKRSFDFVVGQPVAGLAATVRLSDAPLIIIEGQDAPTSCLDREAVFLKYQHHIGIISSIDWKESESSLTEDEYIRQYDRFEAATPKGGVLVFFEGDPVVNALSNMERPDIQFVPYKTHASHAEGGKEFLVTANKERLPLPVSGKHNLQNISAAKEVVRKLGVTPEMFYQAIPSFNSTGLGA